MLYICAQGEGGWRGEIGGEGGGGTPGIFGA